jgi:hypothetical protein
MVQEIKIRNASNNTSYTLESTTDRTTLTLSDDIFAQIMAIDRLTQAINRLAGNGR